MQYDLKKICDYVKMSARGDVMDKKIIDTNLLKKVFASYILPFILLVILNITAFENLFERSEGNIFEGGAYALIYFVMMAGILLMVAATTPFCFAKNIGDDVSCDQPPKTDEPQPDDSPVFTWGKFLSVVIPSGTVIAIQTVFFAVCAMFSWTEDASLLSILLIGLVCMLIAAVWTLVSSFVYCVAGSVMWYLAGMVIINFAPVLIVGGCCEIYNAHPSAPFADYNPLNFVTIIGLPAVMINSWVGFAVVVAVVGVILLLKWLNDRKKINIDRAVVYTVYKFVMIILVSLSVAFMLTSLETGDQKISAAFVILFCVIALATAILMGFLVFKGKRIVKIVSVALVVAVGCGCVFGVIPAVADADSEFLPKARDVEKVSINLTSTMEIKGSTNVEDCVEIHEELLNLFEQGYESDRSNQAYVEPKCIVDELEDFSVTYTLKNSKRVYRSYTNLRDPAFNTIFIKLLKSDFYLNSLKEINPYGNTVRYNNRSVTFLVDEFKTLINTYVNEMKNASDSVFYKNYFSLRFQYSNGAEYYYTSIMIPVSFDKTKNYLYSVLERKI